MACERTMPSYIEKLAKPIARAPAPTAPSHPRKRSPLTFSSETNISSSTNDLIPFDRAHTFTYKIRFSFRFKKNQCELHSNAPRRFMRMRTGECARGGNSSATS